VLAAEPKTTMILLFRIAIAINTSIHKKSRFYGSFGRS